MDNESLINDAVVRPIHICYHFPLILKFFDNPLTERTTYHFNYFFLSFLRYRAILSPCYKDLVQNF